jgi:hypothetical protein
MRSHHTIRRDRRLLCPAAPMLGCCVNNTTHHGAYLMHESRLCVTVHDSTGPLHHKSMCTECVASKQTPRLAGANYRPADHMKFELPPQFTDSTAHHHLHGTELLTFNKQGSKSLRASAQATQGKLGDFTQANNTERKFKDHRTSEVSQNTAEATEHTPFKWHWASSHFLQTAPTHTTSHPCAKHTLHFVRRSTHTAMQGTPHTEHTPRISMGNCCR